jgi:hypothetical protein
MRAQETKHDLRIDEVEYGDGKGCLMVHASHAH